MEKYGDELFNGANGKLFEFARALRKKSTDAEDILWQCLRRKQLNGFKFRRQHPIDKYIADFYCHEVKLVVEVDGEIHNRMENKQYDQERTDKLGELDINVIRFTNKEVQENLEMVLNVIINYLKNNPIL